MNKRFEPEVGQAVWGNATREFDVPDIWDAALRMLRAEMENRFGGWTDYPWESPFSNSAGIFTCETFVARAGYHVSEDAPEDEAWNFKWGDVKIGWYKHSQRSLSANMELTPDLAAKMLSECLAAVQRERRRIGEERGVPF